jgi:23S rRNA (guanosine2251-2'-O)-methyltransferase
MSEYLYGRNPVYESLRAGRRLMHALYLADGVEERGIVGQIVSLAEARGLRVRHAPRRSLDERAGGVNHQGLLLEAGAYPYVALDDVLDLARQRDEPPFVLLLDLLQDVQNVGALVRVAEAVGVHGVVIQERRAATITPAVVNASSGAVEHLLVARVTNLVRAMEALRQAEVWLAGLDQAEGALRYDQADLSGAIGLVVGSEGVGLRRLVRETCDFLIVLPMRGAVASLNAATAGSVALYAIWQARGFGSGRLSADKSTI